MGALQVSEIFKAIHCSCCVKFYSWRTLSCLVSLIILQGTSSSRVVYMCYEQKQSSVAHLISWGEGKEFYKITILVRKNFVWYAKQNLMVSHIVMRTEHVKTMQ